MSKVYYGNKKSPATLIIIMTCIFIILIGGLLAFVGKGYSKITEENKKLITENKDLVKDISDLKNKNNTLSNENVDLINRLDRKTQETKNLTNENQTLKDKNDILTEEKETLTGEKEDLVNRLDEKTQETKKITNDNQALKDKNDILTEKNSTLQDLVNDYGERVNYLTTDYYVEYVCVGYYLHVNDHSTFCVEPGIIITTAANTVLEWYNELISTDNSKYFYSYDLISIKKIGSSELVCLNKVNLTRDDSFVVKEVNFSFNFDDSFSEDDKTYFYNDNSGNYIYQYECVITAEIVDNEYTFNVALNLHKN